MILKSLTRATINDMRSVHRTNCREARFVKDERARITGYASKRQHTGKRINISELRFMKRHVEAGLALQI